jgi:hypothetical protein
MLLLLLLACADSPPPTPNVAEEAPALPNHRRFASAAEAVQSLLADDPRVIGVGEVHETTESPPGTSTLARFTAELLPVLAPRSTDLVIETWRLDAACGAPAEAVVAQVEVDTKRPEETKSEIVLLAEAAKARGVTPHDLVFTCDEYAGLTGPDGAVVYDALLKALTAKLGAKVDQALARDDVRLVLYGGAMHNDRAPRPGAEAYSYGTAAAARGGDGYVELDLYDPARVAGKALFVDPEWEPLLSEVGPEGVLLVERGPRSHVLLMPAVGAP